MDDRLPDVLLELLDPAGDHRLGHPQLPRGSGKALRLRRRTNLDVFKSVHDRGM
jgi:hypothetical protein